MIVKIFLFKTNIQKESDKKLIRQALLQYKGIKKWGIDFESKNKVMRIEGYGVTTEKIIEVITKAGFHCKVLPLE